MAQTEEQYEDEKYERRHRFDDEKQNMEISKHEDNAPQYDFEHIKSERAFKKAAERDMVVILPEKNQLLIDIDSQDAAMTYSKNVGKFELHIAKVIDGKFEKSQSGGEYNYHYTITLDKDIADDERISYQLFLGSDRTRELLSYVRWLNNDLHPTLFLEKKPEPQKLLTAGDFDSQFTDGYFGEERS